MVKDIPVLARFALCVCAALPLAASGAESDDLSGADLAGLSLEELLSLEVRVASRIPANTLTAASSVKVIPESAWQRRAARSISDVLATVPGVSIAPALAGGDGITIRGYTRSTSVIGVLLTWDGVPLNDLFRGAPTLNVPSLNLAALDEIQMVEGPGSALYGAGAFHGVVGLRPYDGGENAGEVRADLRSNGFYSAGTRFSNALGDRARMSVAVVADGQSDQDLDYAYADPATGTARVGERENRYGAESVSLKFRGSAGDDVTWRGGALLHHYDGDDFQGFGTRLAGTRDFGGIDTDLLLINGGVRKQRANGDALELAAYAWSSDSVLFAGRTAYDFESANEQSRWGVNGTYEKALPDASTQLAVVVGAEQLAVDHAVTRNYDLTGAITLDGPNASSGAHRRVYNATFEGQTRWSDDRWRVVYGARADDYSDFGSQTTPRVGLIWHPQPRNAIKLLYGKAFRAPSANDLRGTPGLIQPNPELGPETITTRELVLMHQADQWFMQGTLFQSSWRDGIVSVANMGGGDPFIFTNLEHSSSHGVTWELNWQNEPWLLNVGASWVRSENETRNENYAAFPRYIVDAELGYSHPAWKTRFYLVQHWQLHTDDLFPPSAGIPATRLPQYSRMDIGAIRQLNAQLNLMVTARNLLDHDNFYPSNSGSRGGIPDYPRMVSVEVRFAF